MISSACLHEPGKRRTVIRERLDTQSWVPSWIRHQHVARYEWARDYCGGKRVLDAACGNGYGSRILRSVGWVVGADLAPEAIVDGLDRLAVTPMMIADTTAMPFASSKFDVFVSFETIEHVRDDQAYVAEARRVLVDGGRFLCSTPNRRVVNPANTLADPPFNPHHLREYDAGELHHLLESSFSRITMMGQTPYHDRYVRALAAAGRVSGRAAVRLHQLRKLASMPVDSRDKHEPRPMAAGFEPEVLIAICQ